MPEMCYNAGNDNARLKYSGKPFDEEMGLNKYHFGFREYDPELGRWNRPDPLYFKNPNESPYNFVSNNPVNYYDIMGLDKDAVSPFLKKLRAETAARWAGWGADYGSAPSVGGGGGGGAGGGGNGHYEYVFKYDFYERIDLEIIWIEGTGYGSQTWTQHYYDNPHWEKVWVKDEGFGGYYYTNRGIVSISFNGAAAQGIVGGNFEAGVAIQNGYCILYLKSGNSMGSGSSIGIEVAWQNLTFNEFVEPAAEFEVSGPVGINIPLSDVPHSFPDIVGFGVSAGKGGGVFFNAQQFNLSTPVFKIPIIKITGVMPGSNFKR